MTRLTDRTVLVDGLPPLTRRPDFWARALSETMDLLTYWAIYATSEVQTWPFVVAVGIVGIRAVTRFRLKTLWMVAGFILLLFLGFQLVLRLQLHPIVAAAHVAPIAMAWIGISRGGEDFWGWRIGLGFIGLILASALTPDFSVMLMILTFIICGSIALACRFLSGEFVRRGVIGSLPPGFIRSNFYQSGILLLSALLIFPLIPRVAGKGGTFGNDTPKSGYTEDVNLNEWTRVSNQGSSAPALRIYGPNGADPNTYIPSGLLRTRILSILDANRWNPAPTRIDPTRTVHDSADLKTLTIVREMIGPANLPVPYGTQNVSIEMYGYRWGAEKSKISEWREGRSRNQRYTYFVTIDPDAPRAPQDAPTAVELAVPENFRSFRMKSLAERLFQGKKSAAGKIEAVQNYFVREKLQAVYAEDDPGPKGDLEDRKLPPIERFLFIEKSGHCELFASAMAILLRMGGVPTRLVAGFRVTRNAYGDVLTVRQSDAHAWVEAFVPGHGWRALDPTPKVLYTSTFTDWVRDTYDWASAKWTQYILNYGEGENSLAAQWEKAKKIGSQVASGKNPFKDAAADANAYLFFVLFAIGAFVFSFSAIFLLRALRRRREGVSLDRAKLELISERKRMDRICARLATAKETREIELAIREWFALYEKARFGAADATDRETLAEIRRRRTALEAEIRRAS
jgi:transglutaminase-like putative cysteine protease